MAKKVYDIVPPKQAKRIEENVKNYLHGKESRAKRSGKVLGKSKQQRSIWWPVSIGGSVVLVVVGIFLFFKLPKVDVEIWPKVQTLSFQIDMTSDTSAVLIDITENVIPAERFEKTKTLSQDYPATGNASGKGRALGVITIYNKYDPPQSITFRAGTHFLSDSGKLFRAEKRIVIPSAKKSGGKVVPGSVQVEVIAVEGGDSYNIPASNFSVPGLKGTAYYYSVYAISENSMEGGFTGDIKKIIEDDLISAHDNLVQELEKQTIDEIKNQVSSDYVFPEQAFSSEVVDVNSKAEVGTVVDSFTYEATVKTTVLAFKKSSLDEFAKKVIISQMPDDKTILESSLTTEYSVAEVEIKEGKMTLETSFSGGVYKSVDKNSISLTLPGKNAEQINAAITGILGNELDKVKINFWPFWVSKTPNSQKAIHIDLKFQ